MGIKDSRTSHEVRGLKYVQVEELDMGDMSHLTRGAWIEILQGTLPQNRTKKSHLTRGAWIEIEWRGYQNL